MALKLLDRWPHLNSLLDKKGVTPKWQLWFTQLVDRVNYLLTGIQSGEGSPEGIVTAPQGALFRRTDGGAATSLYVKTSGGTDPLTLTNTGWVAK